MIPDRSLSRPFSSAGPSVRALHSHSALAVQRRAIEVSQSMKRYLITGASRGIGRAIAEKLAGKDVELLLHGRDTVALAQTCKVVESQCTKVTPLIHDLATARGVSDLIAEVGRQPIDLLVNNAGIAVVKPFTEITRSMGANCRCECHCAVPVNAAFCASDVAGFERRQCSFRRGKNRVLKLERLLYEQVCARRLLALRTRRVRDRKVRVINVYPAATDTEIGARSRQMAT